MTAPAHEDSPHIRETPGYRPASFSREFTDTSP